MLNNIHQKIFWSDAILQALDLNQQSYTYSDIQDALKKNFVSKIHIMFVLATLILKVY